MNPFSFVLWIILIVTAGKIVMKLLEGRPSKADPRLEHENRELRKEIEEMRDRLKVLERITVEKENSLAREIESLRDKPGQMQ
ncbi:hypothetical protein [Sphingomicrobium lutaoense]|uniref:Beta-lactamase regulating signal transducer with metallopeptidase domain n=1 Tax=Sphingomicrobium lutaoense TaxID=515949 RepID=A0A839Z237_9SPHN|nr:hypothetical protein [Sphingomicrobium lutaoense]MBB3763655.1 beta-lactamase regulating signal transducer with metallopeptidase domain [Sphingomicrobium lutaoense]